MWTATPSRVSATDLTAPDSDGVAARRCPDAGHRAGRRRELLRPRVRLPGDVRFPAGLPQEHRRQPELHVHPEPGGQRRGDWPEDHSRRMATMRRSTARRRTRSTWCCSTRTAKFQARVAANYLSKQYQGTFTTGRSPRRTPGLRSGRMRRCISTRAFRSTSTTLPGLPAGLESYRGSPGGLRAVVR